MHMYVNVYIQIFLNYLGIYRYFWTIWKKFTKKPSKHANILHLKHKDILDRTHYNYHIKKIVNTVFYKMLLYIIAIFTKNVFYSSFVFLNQNLRKIIYVISLVSGKLKLLILFCSWYQFFRATRQGDIIV